MFCDWHYNFFILFYLFKTNHYTKIPLDSMFHFVNFLLLSLMKLMYLFFNLSRLSCIFLQSIRHRHTHTQSNNNGCCWKSFESIKTEVIEDSFCVNNKNFTKQKENKHRHVNDMRYHYCLKMIRVEIRFSLKGQIRWIKMQYILIYNKLVVKFTKIVPTMYYFGRLFVSVDVSFV